MNSHAFRRDKLRQLSRQQMTILSTISDESVAYLQVPMYSSLIMSEKDINWNVLQCCNKLTMSLLKCATMFEINLPICVFFDIQEQVRG